MSTTGPATAAAIPTPVAPPAPPSVHVRAVITWLAIFPLVAVGMILIGPISESWHPVLRAFALTVVVVPLAVYLVVPRLLAVYGAMRRRRIARAGQGLH
ncbi:antibiotic biosynthesis monooxygenase (ABM) superfamily enzyme [Agromyces cerinus]|uniref:hypothetical protein n=1 Tax=Agromyces cerinus TaxID=33878 RepID=UPI00195BB6B3|nr:hypothetical protein [Agromyces cerinus]MBM7829432.1 antibiotic biosynthesis monooxygenase (ABM) superfamily enzyme [Agromyces cerinus]